MKARLGTILVGRYGLQQLSGFCMKLNAVELIFDDLMKVGGAEAALDGVQIAGLAGSGRWGTRGGLAGGGDVRDVEGNPPSPPAPEPTTLSLYDFFTPDLSLAELSHPPCCEKSCNCDLFLSER